MSLQTLIDNQLLQEQRERDTREHSGMWVPSRFGRCYRMQFWARQGTKETNLPELKMLRRWKVGHLFHEYAQSFFPPESCEVKVTHDDILGYADVVQEDRVIDIKSVSDWEFKYLVASDYDVTKEKITNCMQVCTYSWLLKKPYASLYFIDTMSSASVEFDVPVATFLPKIMEELSILRGYWDKNEVPPPQPKAYINKKGICLEGKYCAYCTKCLDMGFDCIAEGEKMGEKK